MAVHAGKAGVVKAGSDAVGEVRSWTIEEAGETADGTAMGATWRTNVATLRSWTGSLTCWFDDADAGQTALVSGATVALEVMPTGETAGEAVYSGNAIITAVSRTAAVDGVIEATFSFTGDGALTVGTVSI
jgi:hypothetical protein